MTYKESERYLLETGLFNRAILTCSYVEDNTIWLVEMNPLNGYPAIKASYKLNKKTAQVLCKYQTPPTLPQPSHKKKTSH